MYNIGKTKVTQLCPTLATPWTVAHRRLCSWNSPGKNIGASVPGILQARILEPLFLEFSRQEYWSGLPLPTPGGLPVGTEPVSLASSALAGGFFTTMPPWRPDADAECIYKQLPPRATGA